MARVLVVAAMAMGVVAGSVDVRVQAVWSGVGGMVGETVMVVVCRVGR